MTIREETPPSEYLAAVQRALAGLGPRRQRTPAGLLDQWSAFVELCEESYRSTIYEYEDEIGVRDAIQRLLDDPEVSRFPEAREWAQRIRVWDDRFRRLLEPLPRPRPGAAWWKAGVPRYGGPEFAEDIRRIHGLEIEVRE